MINKEAKYFFDYYQKIVETEEYQDSLKKSGEQGLKVHREYIQKEHPDWMHKTDYFDDYSIAKVMIVDVLTNDGIIELLKKLYSLPKERFKVYNYFKKPGMFKSYDYVKLKYSSYSYGKFAEIKISGDEYLKGIDISWSQINNYQAILEYSFNFKKLLDTDEYQNFIKENINNFTSKDYVDWYYLDSKDDKLNYLAIEQMTENFLSLICQHYITTFLYSEQGRSNQLLFLTFATRKADINLENMYFGDISYSLYNKKDNYFITNNFENNKYMLYSEHNLIPNFNLLYLIASYGNQFYYTFFGERELEIFEKEFSKYTTGRKKIKFDKEFTKLLNKSQSILEIEGKEDFSNFKKKFNDKWILYSSNEAVEFEQIFQRDLSKYQKIFTENYSYLKVLSEINYTKNNYRSALVATIVSIVATLISIISLLK